MNLKRRKKRTRGHVIADLAVNFVERQFLLEGHAVDRRYSDYGIDLLVVTFTSNGDVDNGLLEIQVKGTDKPKWSSDREFMTCQIEVAHLNHWLNEMLPVLLVVFDASTDSAYWVNIKAYFSDLAGFLAGDLTNYKSIRIPADNQFTPKAIRKVCHAQRKLRRASAKPGE